MRSVTLGLALLTGLAGPAGAAPATVEEAQRLAALLGSYLPARAAERPAVVVAPQGESYLVTVDLGRALALSSDSGVSVTAGDFAATLTPQTDGRWRVRLDGLPPLGVVQGRQATSWTFDGYTFDGTFDPALRAFASYGAGNRGWTSHLTSGTSGGIDAKLSGASTGSSTAVSAGEGLATVTARTDVSALSYSVTPTGPAGEAAIASGQTTAKAASVASEFTWERMPTVALSDLWRFLAAHPSRPALIAAQAELKDRLRSLVPLAGSFAGSVTLDRVVVETGLGSFALDSLRQRYGTAPAARGVTPSVSIAFAGLSLPDGIAPPFAVPLVPTGLDLTVSFGPLDVATPLRGAIDALDLADTPPISDGQGRALLASLGSEAAALTFGPSSLTLPTMQVRFQGVTRFTKPIPAGSATVSAVGLDKTIAAIRAAAAGDPMGNQAITLLLAAKGLGRADGPDSYSWQIESEPAGTVKVNGTSLGDIAPPGQGR